jgi:hypothetical protein
VECAESVLGIPFARAQLSYKRELVVASGGSLSPWIDCEIRFDWAKDAADRKMSADRPKGNCLSNDRGPRWI